MQPAAVIRVCRAMASLKLTLVALFFFAAGVIVEYLALANAIWVLVLPLLLLSVNLLAAIATNPVFRRSGALLVFHLALLTLVVLVALGRMSGLKGHLELSEGEEFNGQLTELEAAPWHRSTLDGVHFRNEGFSISYAPGLKRERTRNAVRYMDADGRERFAEIGDQTPLVLNGYRFYTSPNKGYAPAFLWYPAAGGEPMLGAVHLPSYPANAYRQSRDWMLPGTAVRIWTQLQFDETILNPEKPSQFRFPENFVVVVRIGEARHELKPGEALALPEGRLVFQGLRSWMGYTVFYDWTLHWLLGTALVAVGALGWYFWNKFAAQPWDRPA